MWNKLARLSQGVIFLLLILSITQVFAYDKNALPDFTGLVKENASSVVNISTTKQVNAQRGLPPGMEIPNFPEDSPFGEFFRRFFGEGQGDEFFNSKSLGSGFILSADGYILTNHHVVQDADEITVKLNDRRELVAKVIGSDQLSDIAVLKVDASSLVPVKIGSTSNLEVGQWVLAIGSPFGFDYSVTAGIVSAKGRSLPTENYVPFIQTDVAINPGNSGGPLFDLDGKVVGINSQIYTRSGGFMGLSFAIPIEVAMDVVDQIKKHGFVSRGWLGVYIQEVTRELAESFGMDKPTGALVAKILPNSPAENTDIKVGDIILYYDDKEVPNSAALPPMVGRTHVGDEVKLKIMRDGKLRTAKIKIGQLPEKEQVAAVPKTPEGGAKETVLGLVVRELTDEEKKFMELDDAGIMVVEVGIGVAKNAGVREGDIIQMINGEKVKTTADFKKIANKLPKGKFASILVQRPQGPEFLALKVPE